MISSWASLTCEMTDLFVVDLGVRDKDSIRVISVDFDRCMVSLSGHKRPTRLTLAGARLAFCQMIEHPYIRLILHDLHISQSNATQLLVSFRTEARPTASSHSSDIQAL